MNKTDNTPFHTDLTDADYREAGWLRRLSRLQYGLRQPRGTRAFKEARIELQRLSAPLAAVLLPALAVLLLTLLPSDAHDRDLEVGIEILKPEKIEPLKPLDPETAEHPPTENPQLDPVILVSDPPLTPTDNPPPEHATPLPDPFQPSIRHVLSPVTFTGLYGEERSAGLRGTHLAGNGGDQMTEDAVLRALRWLKKNQQADGSWKAQKVAMTGLAALCFLAHGEVTDPAKSPEFATTLQRALEFLLASQRADGRFGGADSHEYAHPIAAYALCEAYGMTLNPNLKEAATRALRPILAGQHPTGGWTYRLDPAADPANGAYRDDTSYMGWCVQALKAAKLAHIPADGLDRALKLSVRGFKRNAAPSGGFGYTGPGAGGLTAVGTLSLQLLGSAQDPEVRRSLELMDGWQPSFEAKGPMGASLQYYFYYTTQCRFHAGGKRWESWNREMKRVYVRAQQVERGAALDPQGRACDIGWWVNGDAHTDRPVMDTCLAALQLMVYYRSLATTQHAATRPDQALAVTTGDTGDIPVLVPATL